MYPSLTADEAAWLIPNGAMVAVSGFTPAGNCRSVPRALAHRARELHDAGMTFHVKLLSGSSTGAACDDELAVAEASSTGAANHWKLRPLRVSRCSVLLFGKRTDGHIGHDLRRCFDIHMNYLEHGAMLPELNLRIFESNQVWRQSNADLQLFRKWIRV